MLSVFIDFFLFFSSRTDNSYHMIIYKQYFSDLSRKINLLRQMYGLRRMLRFVFCFHFSHKSIRKYYIWLKINHELFFLFSGSIRVTSWTFRIIERTFLRPNFGGQTKIDVASYFERCIDSIIGRHRKTFETDFDSFTCKLFWAFRKSRVATDLLRCLFKNSEQSGRKVLTNSV